MDFATLDRPLSSSRRWPVAILLVTLLIGPVFATAQAQTPETERPVPSRVDQHFDDSPNPLPSVLRRQLRPEKTGTAAVSSSSDPSLFMRAGAGLTGVDLGPSAAVGDVNEDGNPDLLVTGRRPDDLDGDGFREASATLYLGNDDGTFSAADANLEGAHIYTYTSITDVDGDGHLDLFISGEDEKNADIEKLYWGHGDGTFTDANVDLEGGEGGSHSIADVNGDGHKDILLTGRESGQGFKTSLYLGNGDRTFSKANVDLVDSDFGSTNVADVNEDGHADILITGRAGFSAGDPPSATLYLGAADGSFSEANAGLKGVTVSSSSIADVNGDGHLDILIAGYDGTEAATTLYLGDGQGKFMEANVGLTGLLSGSTAIADVNGDGHPDLLLTGLNNESSPTTALYRGNGDGTFSEVDAGLTGVTTNSTPIADLDGDGDQDLLIVGKDDFFGPSARIYVNRTQQSGSNRSPRLSQTFSAGPLPAGLPLNRHVEAGDPDGDLLSLQLAQGPSNASFTDAGNGLASLTFAPNRSQGGNDVSFRVEARDPDGKMASFSTSVEISSVMAALPGDLAAAEEGATSIADVNSDGHPDLLVNGYDGNALAATLHLGNGDGTFSEAGANLTGTSRGSTSIEDVNGDGHADVLITGYDGSGASATLYLGNGNGTFTEANANLGGFVRSSSVIANLNGDDHPDILISGLFESDGTFSTTTNFYEGNGDGTFQKVNTNLVGVEQGSISIADVNGDGNHDVLLTGRAPSNVSKLYLGDGFGDFDEANAGLEGVSSSSSSIGDVNGDGHPDLLITGSAADGPSSALYLGNGDGSFSEPSAGLPGVANQGASIADVDGDGNPDLLLSNMLYLGDGTGRFTQTDVGLDGGATHSLADVDGDRDPDLLLTGWNKTTRSQRTTLYENLYDAPLPTDMTSFEVQQQTNDVTINWTPSPSPRVVSFHVQRKRDGSQWGAGAWTTIRRVEVSGASNSQPQEYQVTDARPPYTADSLWYRIKHVKADSSARYSASVRVDRSVSELQLLGPFPNPTQDRVTIRYAVPTRQEVSLQIYDVLGRQIQTVFGGPRQGRHTRSLDVSRLPSGVYFLRLRAEGQAKTQKLTVVQ